MKRASNAVCYVLNIVACFDDKFKNADYFKSDKKVIRGTTKSWEGWPIQ